MQQRDGHVEEIAKQPRGSLENEQPGVEDDFEEVERTV